MSHIYNLENIKTILIKGFTIAEILDIIHNHFSEHYINHDYAGKNAMLLDKTILIQQFVSYCERTDKISLLCDILSKLRPGKVMQYPCEIDNFDEAQNSKFENGKNYDTYQKIRQLLLQNHTVKQALQLLQKKLPNENTIILFFGEYNQLSSDITKGITKYNSVEWRSLVSRILEFTDRFKSELN